MSQRILTPAQYTAYLPCAYCQRFVIQHVPMDNDPFLSKQPPTLCDDCWRLGEPYRTRIAEAYHRYASTKYHETRAWRAACPQAVQEGHTPHARM